MPYEGHYNELYRIVGAIVDSLPTVRKIGGSAVSARFDNVYIVEPVEPEMVARALLRIGRILDDAEDGKKIEAHPALPPSKNAVEERVAWMVAALLIADRCEIDSLTLAAMAGSVFKGSQDVLFG